MKKIIKAIITNMIFYALILSAIVISSKIIINNYGIEFRNWFYVASIIMISLFFVIGIIQIICKTHDIAIKVFLISTFIIFIGVASAIAYFFYDLFIPYEIIVQKQGKRLIGQSYSFLTTKITYYDYINLIVRGKDVVLYEELDS